MRSTATNNRWYIAKVPCNLGSIEFLRNPRPRNRRIASGSLPISLLLRVNGISFGWSETSPPEEQIQLSQRPTYPHPLGVDSPNHLC